MKIPYNVTLEQQKEELLKRVPPVLYIDLVVANDKHQYLLGKKKATYDGIEVADEQWLFPGGSMKWNETIEDAVERKLREELPGITVNFKGLVAANSDRGFDQRAYGVTLYYYLQYVSGKPLPNNELEEFDWLTKEDLMAAPRALWLHKEVVERIDDYIKRNPTYYVH